MNKFCHVCKSYFLCNYCTKYGRKGIYIYLEQQKSKQKINTNFNTIDIHKQQLMSLSKK